MEFDSSGLIKAYNAVGTGCVHEPNPLVTAVGGEVLAPVLGVTTASAHDDGFAVKRFVDAWQSV